MKPLKNNIKNTLFAFSLVLTLPSTTWAKAVPATNFQATHDFINQMVVTHQFNKDELLFIFAQIDFVVSDKKNNKPIKKVKRTISWDKYKRLFITNERINNGVEFWQKYEKTLKRASKKYQIPTAIIVAILGIETNYGRKKGTHPTLATLAKLAFSNHYRKKFYAKELQEFLLMARENALPPLAIEGSYAGAMGYAQFIASSYRHYAVDFNLDGKVDLFSDPIDAIGSIANYFNKHYWQKNGAFASPIHLNTNQRKYASTATNKPRKTAEHWLSKGLDIDTNINNATKIALIQLPQNTNNETWLTFWNFYVLTRYNHDNKYAMAAYQLSEKLKVAYDATTRTKSTNL